MSLKISEKENFIFFIFLFSSMYIPDSKDLKIIEVLADQGKLSYAEIGHLVHLSKDRVKARLMNLVDNKIILSFMPLINYNLLGYELFHVFIKFGSLVKKMDSFIQGLMNNGFIVSVTRVIGEFDFELQILAKDTKELYSIINPLLLFVKKNVTRTTILNSLSYHIYTMQIKKSHKTYKPLTFPRLKIHRTLDKIDFQLLKKLSVNARESFVNLASSMKTSPENIRYRLKKLTESGLISSFHARTSKHALGLNTYIFLLDVFQELTQQDIRFLNILENVYYVKSCVGQWNVIINFYAKDNDQLAKTLWIIRNNFKDKLNSYELLILLNRYKFIPVPDRIHL